MLRKLIVFALTLAVLLGATVHPSYAQTRDQGQREVIELEDVALSIGDLPADPYRNFKFLVKMDGSSDVRLGKKYAADDFAIDVENPPPPSPYHVWYWLADWGVLLDCVYDDDTGELLYCDIYA
jgi:hypothetical protein